MVGKRFAEHDLDLRQGEIVEIRSESEILATLDGTGARDGLPFMPEMLAYCGQRVRVAARADKTCDTIERTGGRRMTGTVHLEGLRCDGQAHGGCQAGCFLFWKEAWLKRVSGDHVRVSPAATVGAADCDRARLSEASLVDGPSAPGEPRYRCQATELRRASSPLAWWDIRQYVRDVRCGNVGVGDLLSAFAFWLFQQIVRIGGYRVLTSLYDALQARRGGTPYPFRGGTLTKTPRETLGLTEGELVRVKSFDEILRTLDTQNRNRGLRFDPEMVRFCGEVRRVRARVDRIIDEKTGLMLKFSNDCIILEGVVCPGRVSAMRMFCPRSIYSYWREIWLQRLDADRPHA
jgi:hypothetical protein